MSQPWLKVRASTNTSHKAPNLIVVVNEGMVVRNVSQEDPLITAALQNWYDQLNADADPLNDQETFPNYSIQRVAKGNPDLVAEESTNSSLGLVITPLDNLVVTVDMWEIAQENTLGLFGERNHILYDTLLRLQGGPNECSGNPNVIRFDYDVTSNDDPVSVGYTEAWDESILCKAGNIQRVNDTYLNLDDRTLKGTDYVIEYAVETDFGLFSAKLMRVQFDEFTQEAGGVLAEVIEAGQPGGILDGLVQAAGYGDLIGTWDRRAYPKTKDTMRLAYKHKQFDAFLTGTKVGSFTDVGFDNDEGTQDWVIDSMLTLNLTLGYKFKNGLRVRGSL